MLEQGWTTLSYCFLKLVFKLNNSPPGFSEQQTRTLFQ